MVAFRGRQISREFRGKFSRYSITELPLKCVGDVDLYEEFLRSTYLPSIHSIKEYLGASEDFEAAHVAPRAKELLPRFDARCLHLQCVVEDRPAR